MKNFRIFLINVLLLFPLGMFAQQTINGTVTEAQIELTAQVLARKKIWLC